MKRLLILASLAAVAVPVTTALAGGGAQGFPCENACPLAKQANALRSTGEEATQASPAVRTSLAVRLRRNLERV